MMAGRSTIFGLALALLLGGGCKEDKPTGVLLEIRWSPPIPGLDQVVVRAYPELDATDTIDATIPDAPVVPPIDQSPTSILLLFPKEWAGKTVSVRIEAMLGGSVVAHASRDVPTIKGKIVESTVDLIAGEPVCGNGAIEGLEQCDATDFAGQTCRTAAGIDGGQLGCTQVTCILDISGCSICGDGAVTGSEACDGDGLLGKTCESLGLGTGELKCRGDCVDYDTSGCDFGCPNGRVDPGEECDGTNFDGQTCLTAAGVDGGTLRCDDNCHLDVSGCHDCGNGILEPGELCDGAAFGGQSCDASGWTGQLTCSPDCTAIDTSNCCGDGNKGFFEQCDGTDFGGQTCMTMIGVDTGSLRCTADCHIDVSGCHSCGNSIIEPGEVCEGSNLNGETCLSRGHLLGTGLQCSPTCEAFDTSGCGARINTEANIQTGLNQAAGLAGHQVVSVHYLPNPIITISGTITVNDTQGQADGVTLQPLDGRRVCLEAQAVFTMFNVLTGNNVFQDLCITEASGAYTLSASNNTVIRNEIRNNGRTPLTLITVQDVRNSVESNRFENATAALGTRAILVTSEDNDVVMNVIRGSYQFALEFNGFTSPTQETNIDHNSIHITGGLGGGGLRLEAVDMLCYRNNIIWGDTTSTGVETLVNDTAFAPGTVCAQSVRFGYSVNENHQTQCLGAANDCDSTCHDPGGGLCDLTDDPVFTGPGGCLGSGSGLIDAGIDVGWDMVDGSVDDFLGSAPEVGAREIGSSRSYGTVASWCPP
jgi:hypothetical protein